MACMPACPARWLGYSRWGWGVGSGSRERLPGARAEGLGQQEGKENWTQANNRLSATGNYYAFKALKLMESLLTF